MLPLSIISCLSEEFISAQIPGLLLRTSAQGSGRVVSFCLLDSWQHRIQYETLETRSQSSTRVKEHLGLPMLSRPKKGGLHWNLKESETHFTVPSYWAFRMAVIAIILPWPDWCTSLNQEWSFPERKEGKKGPCEHLKYETITSWWAVWTGKKSCCRRYCTEQAFYENCCLWYQGTLSQWGKWLGGTEPAV